ncbi:hypothetical protein [Mucilaginibacter paludis]|uniref:Uncharacterized protein n=1 Tax=Mucilaginibacter paludis DSM 18603 TaxID=714943 RepID=H1Y256_9SPHI|nr:hypothetical protein [Mucilaginibacter paludis]EHQ26713.1 hypothetical protein Mucpa_2598 [Mucilaginibacter paludis DSM 18603]
MEVQIQLYDKREKVLTTTCVEKLTENRFRMAENDIFDCRLTKGTEFETRLNQDGQHVIVRVIKNSEYVTRRFLLPINFNVNDYRMLGDELGNRGGFWQVDFGGFLTINIPKNFEFDIDSVIKEFELKVSEIR